MKGLKTANHVLIVRKRYYDNKEKVNFHGFCDSQGKTYTQLMLWISTAVKLVFLFFTPSSNQTIPHLELLPCVLLLMLIDNVLKAVIEKVLEKDEK